MLHQKAAISAVVSSVRTSAAILCPNRRRSALRAI
jgi:hypothetical protein